MYKDDDIVKGSRWNQDLGSERVDLDLIVADEIAFRYAKPITITGV